MDLFDILTMIGGLCLFLFGMNVMGNALERRAGDTLRTLLGKLTTNKLAGILTGLGVTAVIQSSSATTVMVVGFVNSGLMTLSQAINVIMGANVGTTVTAWILSLGAISSDNIILKLLKPTSFTPILALIGIIFYMFLKSSKKKDTGMILLGFAVLMFGMDTMSGAVSGLKDVPAFADLFIMFKNPILGVLAGAILTAIIQSSSASVGILQALAVTGQVSFGAAIPIIMGQNIGTCITALLSSIGANKNARRASLVHLSFNVLGSVIWLAVYMIVDLLLHPALLDQGATSFGIAVAHSCFNVGCLIILLPMAGLLEKLAKKLIPDTDASPEEVTELDERLLMTPPMALERCHDVASDMARCSVQTLKDSLKSFSEYSADLASSIRENEDKSDHYEDILGTYLVKLSALQISEDDSAETAKLLHIIGDFERISDHGVDLLCSAEEIREKNINLSESASAELKTVIGAVSEILDLSLSAYLSNDMEAAAKVEPLEQVIDSLKDQLRARHIVRLQQGACSIEAGFVWSDILTALERTSDHCSNIAGCIIDMANRKNRNLNLHESLRAVKAGDPEFDRYFKEYSGKYSIA